MRSLTQDTRDVKNTLNDLPAWQQDAGPVSLARWRSGQVLLWRAALTERPSSRTCSG